VGREPFSGSIEIRNDGTFAGTASLDYGREGGPRTTGTVTVAPGESRTITFTDTVVAPTTYRLVVSGDLLASFEKTVAPTEGLLARYQGPTTLPPGPAALPFRLTKTGGVEGPVAVTFTLQGVSGPQSLTRTYDLEPGIPRDHFASFDLVEGTSTLTLAAPGVALEADAPVLRVGPDERITVSAAAGAAEQGVLHIQADIANTGLGDFAGEIQVEAVGGSRTPVAVPAGQTSNFDVTVDLAVATPGPNSYPVRLVSEAGIVIAETTLTHEVGGPRVELVGSPEGMAFDPGGFATLRFRLRNTGDQRALGTFAFSVFDEDRLAGFRPRRR
jgi:hypothetical protein